MKMKKYLALLLAVLMIAALAVGCSGDSGTQQSGGQQSGGDAQQPSGGDAAQTAEDEYGTYTVIPDDVKTVTVVYADENREGSVVADGILFLQELVAARSGGKLVIEPHFNLTLGTSNGDIFQSVCAGDITMSTGTPGAAVFGGDTGIMDVPALFSDWDLLWECLQDSEFTTAMNELAASKGATALYWAPKSYRVMTSNVEIKTTADLQGLSMRLPSNPTWIDVWGSFGVNVSSIPMNEVYLSLQNGVCEAQENSWEQIVNNNLLEVQKYLIYTNHVHDAFGMYINTDFYENLDPSVRALLDECLEVTYNWYDTNVEVYLADVEEQAKAQGEKFGTTFMDPDPSFMTDMANATEAIVHDVRAYSDTADNLCSLALAAMGHDANFGK